MQGSESPVLVVQEADAPFAIMQLWALEGPVGPLGGYLSDTLKKNEPPCLHS